MTIDKKAVEFIEKKRPQTSYKWTDVLHNEHGAVFTVAKSTGFDILLDVKSALEDALRGGKTLHQFKKELTPILQDKGWWGEACDVGSVNRRKKACTIRFSTPFKNNL